LQLLNLSVRRVVTIETGCVFQMADDRVIRAVDIVGRTLTADNRVPLACNAVHQCPKNPGFAYAWLAADQCDLTSIGSHSLPK
jgi:hypothetical protein